jgi:metal-responsive CopG/Arc/MetJ family transcriptional regulator
MPIRKTAVSIDEPLFEQADRLAEQMKVSRSRLYALALEMFIQKRKSQQILEQLNRVCGENPPTDEEKQLLEAMQHQQRHVVEGEW